MASDQIVRALLALVATFAVAYMAAELISRLLSRLVGRRALRLVRVVVTLIVGATLIFPALGFMGMRTRVGLTPERLADWAAQSGLRIGLVLLIAWLVTHVTGLVVARLKEDVSSAATLDVIERAKRAQTLGSLIQNTVTVLVSTITVLIVLRELTVDITPILTGAGIVGLAVGFGAQTLVKDIISGFFLILENQVRVGDVANIDGTGGLVERITLRTIILRDEAGTVHVFPNGSIQRLSNLTKDFSFYVTSISVAYREDTDRVITVLKTIASGMQDDPSFAPFMLAPLEVMGVDKLGASSVDIKVRLKTVPIKQWMVGREFLRRVKQTFEVEGIEIPFPQRHIFVTRQPIDPEHPDLS
jgi:small-conductance mechanosensitive channel